MKPPSLSMMPKDSSFSMLVMMVIVVVMALFLRSEKKTKTPVCQIMPVQGNQPFAQLSGCDMKDFLEDETHGAAILKELMLKHGLLVFRDQHVSPEQELALNKLLGWHLEGAKIANGWGDDKEVIKKFDMMPVLPEMPEVLCQGNADLHDHFGLTRKLDMTLTLSNCGWHSDGVHAQHTDLPIITSMYCLQAPLHAGETLFADGRQAFTSQTPEVQKMARRLRVHYIFDHAVFGGAQMKNGIRRVGYDIHGNATVTGHKGGVHAVHPLIRKHPDHQGEESVFLSCALVDHMEADATETEPAIYLDTEASFQLVETLIGPATSSPLVYAHKWKEGDFVMWDNRVTMHSPGDESQMVGTRLHHRIRLAGNELANRDLREWTGVSGPWTK